MISKQDSKQEALLIFSELCELSTILLGRETECLGIQIACQNIHSSISHSQTLLTTINCIVRASLLTVELKIIRQLNSFVDQLFFKLTFQLSVEFLQLINNITHKLENTELSTALKFNTPSILFYKSNKGLTIPTIPLLRCFDNGAILPFLTPILDPEQN